MKSIVITGSSSGIGKATTKYFAAQGWQVAATMRKPEVEAELGQLENVSLYALDVTDDASVTNATERIIGDFGTVDVVLNNAGYAVMGAFEATSPAQIERQFNVNVFGLMNVSRAFLPHLRANGSGMFVNVSSMGGRITFPFMSLYHGTKWAVEGFSESLAYELNPLGIQVKLIEPGVVFTDFYGRSMAFANQEGLIAYDDLLAKFQAASAANTNAGLTPDKLGEAIYTAVTDGKPQMRYLVGSDAEQMIGMRQTQGDEAFTAFIGQMLS